MAIMAKICVRETVQLIFYDLRVGFTHLTKAPLAIGVVCSRVALQQKLRDSDEVGEDNTVDDGE